jgi:hypothetical protein
MVHGDHKALLAKSVTGGVVVIDAAEAATSYLSGTLANCLQTLCRTMRRTRAQRNDDPKGRISEEGAADLRENNPNWPLLSYFTYLQRPSQAEGGENGTRNSIPLFSRSGMKRSVKRSWQPLAVLAALGACFVVALFLDLRALADELSYEHRLIACTGMYELKDNLSGDDPRTICTRVLAESLAMDQD